MDPLARDALAWILRLKSGEATLADAEQLMDWRAKSAAHESAFREALRCWRAIGGALVGDRPGGGHPNGNARRRRRSKRTSN